LPAGKRSALQWDEWNVWNGGMRWRVCKIPSMSAQAGISVKGEKIF